MGSSVINDGVVAGHWTNAQAFLSPRVGSIKNRTYLVRKDRQTAKMPAS